MLRVSALRSSYGRVEVLKGVEVALERGNILALIGPNGAGKTTFLRAVSGVQPVAGGEILFEGRSIKNATPAARVKLGIAQSPEARQVFGPLSVDDNLRLGAYCRTDSEIERDRERVFALFPILAERRRSPAAALSGGQQQMLAIGRALMARPKLLLLDEPSLGLAPILAGRIFATIVQLARDGTTILLVEQNAAAALTIADRGCVMETGRIVLDGPARDLLGNPKVQSAYLGV